MERKELIHIISNQKMIKSFLTTDSRNPCWGTTDNIDAVMKEENNKAFKPFMHIEVKKKYPWSVLKNCSKCGNKHPWMHGFDHPYIQAIVDEPVYRVVCHRCFRHTHKGTYKDIVKEWNEKN